jgi:glycosyltransferase involved in cell wall biosynthesis
MTEKSNQDIRCLVVGVRGHGGEEVYSSILRDSPPPGVRVSATFDFHRSCEWAKCHAITEIALNRVVYPWLAFDMGFRVLRVEPAVDIVHVHTHPTILRGLGDRPIIFSAGSSHYHYLRDYERWPERQIRERYARAQAVYPRLGVLDALLNHSRVSVAYTFSHHARKTYLDFGVPPWKIRVLYPGFDIPAPRRTEHEGVVYLFMGRQPRRKGGDMVLDAFRALRDAMPSARLLYVADELPHFEIEGVEPMPLVPRSEVAALYARADVFVNPTRAEGFGFTNVEAQGFGLPVISTRLGAIPEVVEDGRTGFLIDPEDGSALLAAMRRMGESSALRSEIAGAARERFVSRFSLATFHEGLMGLYTEALRTAA